MKKILLFISLLIISITATAGGGLLWRVSGHGLPAPTYILGSHHLAPPTFVDSIKGLREAIASVDAVYGEVEKEALANSATAMMKYAMAPADSTLSKLLTPADYQSLDSLLNIYMGYPGMAKQFDRTKPAVLSATLMVLMLNKSFPDFSPAHPFDVTVMNLGESGGKPIGGLETAESQYQLLFCAPLTQQAADLMQAVRTFDEQIEQMRDLTDAYLAQDLDKLTEITIDPAYGINPDDLDKLIYNRNRLWADELDRLMPERSLFVVVGCGHLGGDQGLLSLLRSRGYTVESVAR